MDVVIRRLEPDDAAVFHALRLNGLRESPTAFASAYEEERGQTIDVIAGRLAVRTNGAVFGAFAGDALLGIAGIEREKKPKLAHKAMLWGVYVAPEARRHGIGRRVVEAACREGFAMAGVRQINLGVNANNLPAIALYEALGFHPFGLERGFMIVEGRLEDEIYMVRVKAESER